MFITAEEFGTLDGLNKALERLHNKTVEDTLRLLPDIIVGLSMKSRGVQAAFDKFKTEHPEFAGMEKELALAIETIELSNGALTIEEILEKVPEQLKFAKIEIPKDQCANAEEIERSANGYI